MNEYKHRKIFNNGKSWYFRYKKVDNNVVKYGKKGGFASREDAEKAAEEYARQASDGGGDRIRLSDMGERSLKEYLEWWYEEVFSARAGNTTLMLSKHVIFEWITPEIEQMRIPICRLTSDEIDNILTLVSKKTKSAGNKAKEYLRVAFSDAVNLGIINHNPMIGTKRFPRGTPRVRVLESEELKALMKAAEGSKWELEIHLAAFCGLRKGEILGLKIWDIDDDFKTIHIRRQVTSDPQMTDENNTRYTVAEKFPKTQNSVRILHLPELIQAEMKARVKEIDERRNMMGGQYHVRGYVSCSKDGHPHTMSAMNTALSKLCIKAGVPRVTVHGLRHQFATILAEEGVSLARISALLGHASVNTTFEYYVDQMGENKKIISFINDKFVKEGDVDGG